MLVLNREEKAIAATIKRLKDEAGSHSPSVFTLSKELPSLKMKVDACFLSNPYATDLFLRYLEDDIIIKNKLRNILEFYPSQNKVIAEILSKHLRIPSDFIIMGNGAIETIQAVIHNFVKRKVLINLPTFSSYYEFTKQGVEVIYNNLKKKQLPVRY
jgi:histidinol-phosphate/aromatic aminotransferase/cobyric acid decarboxylase-like protein